MRHIKLFEDMEIEENEFPLQGHKISSREKRILTNLVGEEHLKEFEIIVDDHYYYVDHMSFDGFNELKDYILSIYYMDNREPEKLLKLLKSSKLDPSINDNDIIVWACIGGYVDLVKYLLDDPRVDPRGDNTRIRNIFKNGNKEIVRLLLNNKRYKRNQ